MWSQHARELPPPGLLALPWSLSMTICNGRKYQPTRLKRKRKRNSVSSPCNAVSRQSQRLAVFLHAVCCVYPFRVRILITNQVDELPQELQGWDFCMVMASVTTRFSVCAIQRTTRSLENISLAAALKFAPLSTVAAKTNIFMSALEKKASNLLLRKLETFSAYCLVEIGASTMQLLFMVSRSLPEKCT